MPVEYISIAEKILGAIRALFGLRESLVKARLDRRGRMADIFEKVAVCLEATARDIRAGTFPAGQCQQMLTCAVELPLTIKDELGETRANEIGAALQDAYAVERVFALRDKPEGEDQLRKLDEAAGLLRTLADLLPL